MGLINLLTDPKNFKFYNGGQGYTGNGTQPSLTNIPYGKDQIGGGSSNQPYIQIPIPDSVSSLGLANNDFLLRGGILSENNAATDTLRLTKMFFDTKSPSGLLFIAKQQLLSRTAVRTQTSGILNEGGYNPLGTLAQAGIINIGGHLNKQGNILGETGAYSNNNALYSVRVKSTQDALDNRLYGLYNEKIINKRGSLPGIKGFETDPISLNPLLLSYSGGPGSTLGIGKTNIRFADQRTGENNALFNANPNYFRGFYNQVAIGPNQTGPVILHDTSDIPVYISSLKFTATTSSQYTISSNATSKGTGVNNPLAVTNPIYFYSGSSRSVDTANNNQISQGGILINTNQPWTLGSFQIKSGSIEEKQDLTKLKFNVNVAQNQGTNFQIKGPASWTPQHNGPSPLLNAPLGVANNWFNTTELIDSVSIPSLIVTDDTYELDFETSVYQSGSFKNTALINAQGTYTYPQEGLITQLNNPGKLSFSPIIQDFRAVLKLKIEQGGGSLQKAIDAGQLTAAPDYLSQDIEKSVKIGGIFGDGPGARANKIYANYTDGVIYLNKGTSALDIINGAPSYKDTEADNAITDLCNFRIAIIDNDTPTLKTFLHFRAFLDTISDAYTADWNSVKYLGRGENFYTYNGYTRQMSLGWTVAAQSKQELIPMYKRLNYLASSLTPEYSSYGYMRGNMVQFTIGGYIYEMPGIITSLTYTLEADSTWEIGINTSGKVDTSVKQLPHILKVTCNFTPIQKFRPEIQNYDDDYKHYISLEDSTGNSYGTGSVPPDVVPVDIPPTPVPETTNTDGKNLVTPKLSAIKYTPPRYIPDDRYSIPDSDKFDGFGGGGGFNGGGAGGSWRQ